MSEIEKINNDLVVDDMVYRPTSTLPNQKMIEPYNYNDEPSGRADTLAMALDKCERLERQLKIAVEALSKYANKDNWENHYTIDLNDWELELRVFDNGEADDGEFYAQEALKEIKELEK